MIRNGHLVINLKVVGIIVLVALGVSLVAGIIATKRGFFSYTPEVTSVEPVPGVHGAYFVNTTEEPNGGAGFFGFEPREGSYIVMPDSSLLSYPTLETPWDPGALDRLTENIISAMKRKLLEDVIIKRNNLQDKAELVAVPLADQD